MRDSADYSRHPSAAARAFPADDYKRLQETAIAGLMEIFLYDPNSRVRLRAGSILLEYADAGLKLHPEPSEK